jgi:hypothetical protein
LVTKLSFAFLSDHLWHCCYVCSDEHRQAHAARGNEWTEEVRAHRWSSYKNQFGLRIVQAWASGNLWATNTYAALIWRRINSAGDLTITCSVCGRPSGEEARALLLMMLWTWWWTGGGDMLDSIGSKCKFQKHTVIQYNARVAVPLLFSLMLHLHRCYIVPGYD